MAKPTKLVKPIKKTKSVKKAMLPKRLLSPPQTAGQPASALVLDRLWKVVQTRRNADPSVSHSARLLSRGIGKVAQKFGEEAVECLIEAVAGRREALVGESADVLYHLLVLWVASDVQPAEIWQELERREGVSGITEKAARVPLAFGVKTSKIP